MITKTLKVISLCAVALASSGCSLFGVRTFEMAEYKVIESDSEFEIRQYSDYVSAQTTVEGDWDSAVDDAFGRLAGYIFGKNRGEQKISMTGPVFVADSGKGTKMKMTGPVMQEETPEGWKMSFVLPSSVTIDSAPEPLDERVIVTEVKGKKFAVVRFSGVMSEDDLSEYGPKLLEWVEEKQENQVSDPVLAGYDPPWTLPFLRRNEVLVEIE